MKYKFLDGTEVLLDEGVDNTKFLASFSATQAKEVKKIFTEHGYDIRVVPGSFIKMFNMDAKELHEVSLVLDEIDALGLKDVFNANLGVQVFKRVYLERIKFCMNNNIPFLNKDNTFVRQLDNATDFADYTAAMPINEIKTIQEIEENPAVFNEAKAYVLDEEDKTVKLEIIKMLGQISNEASDPTLTAVLSSIYANLDSVIASDNKNYHFMGIRHLVENAFQGEIDPAMQSVFDTKVLPLFPQEGIERGI